MQIDRSRFRKATLADGRSHATETCMKTSILVLGLLTQLSFAQAFSMSNETCWSAKPILKSAAESKKLEDEQKLCGIDFYSDKYSICPKLNSTFPGVLVIKRSENMSDSEFRNNHCARIDEAKDANIAKVVAKFKQTTSCSHASAPVAYYRIAEFLGGIKVPVAVFRTMDKSKHLEIAEQANQIISNNKDLKDDLIAQTWKRFLALHANPSQYPDVFTNDTVYGALSENINGEFKFTEVSGVGSYETRYPRFLKQKPFLAVASSNSVATLAGGTDLKKLAQVVTVMKDVSNMVVIDYMLNQADRIGNVHFKFKLLKQEAGKIIESKSETELDKKTKREIIPADELARIQAGEVLVRDTVLKDNDCGISKENKMREIGALEAIRHMNAKTYRQVQKLASFVETTEGQMYFVNELRIPLNILTSQSSGIKNNIIKAAQILKNNCESGLLKLDLNLEKLLADANYRESCAVENAE